MQPIYTIKKPGTNPRRILIKGPQGCGKSWFAARLAKWLKSHPSTMSVVVDSPMPKFKHRGPGVITVSTANAPTRRERDGYDWIIDLTNRATCDGALCTCDGHGCVTVPFSHPDGQYVNLWLPCTGRDCILKHFCCDDERITAAPKTDAWFDHFQAKEHDAAKQLADLKKITEVVVGKFQDPGALLASEMFHSIDGLAKGIDSLLAAVGSGLPFNDEARRQLRFDVTYHMSRLRGQFGGLKALVDRDARNGPCPF